MDISINIKELLKSNLSINEYFYLRNLYVDEADKIPDLFKLIDFIDEDSLQNKGYIKITEEGITLRQKTIELFEPKDLFYSFLSTFPIKTPSGRYLSPDVNRSSGKAATELKKKWDKAFKNKNHLEQKAIDVLIAELNWRKKTNQMEYIHSAEVWLNQADYEKYEYLLEDIKKQETNNNKNWM